MNVLIPRLVSHFNIRYLKFPISISATSALHTSSPCNSKWNKHSQGPQKWLQQNKIVYQPQLLMEEVKNIANVCHMRTNIKYSPEKMWYIATMIRGLSVDEAVKQLDFVLKKGATHIKEVVLEAQEMAIQQHNVEYKSNLWIAESFVGKGRVFRGVRRHARGRFGRVEYKHCHYFVRLEEGKPPSNYYLPQLPTPEEQLESWLQSMRERKITNSL